MVFKRTQRASLFVGAIALMVGFPGVILTDVQAGNAKPATTMMAQPASGSIIDQLKLSDQQTKTIQTLRKERTQSIAKVLTKAQREKLVQSLQAGTKMGPALQSLNLSGDQKKRIGTIVQKSNQAIEATLTKTQKQQLADYRKQHQTAAQSPE